MWGFKVLSSTVEVAKWDQAVAWLLKNENPGVRYWTLTDILEKSKSDAEAERVGVPAFAAMVESRAALRNRIYRDTRKRIDVPAAALPSPDFVGFRMGNDVTFSWKNSINVVLERISNTIDRIGGTIAG